MEVLAKKYYQKKTNGCTFGKNECIMEYQTLKTTRRFPITEILLAILIVLTLFKGCSNESKPTTVSTRSEKEINRDLRPVLNKIEVHQQRVDDSKPILKSMDLQFADLLEELQALKQLKDTASIIVKQDTMISHQEKQKDLMRQVISDLDSVNLGLRYVVSAKDTIISLKDLQIRKVKRQRNWSLVANGLLTALFFLK